MKTLKKKFSIYQSSQKVRKLWVDYSEARSGESHDPGITVDAANSSETVTSSAIDFVAAGPGPVRALRAFVDAVDLSDAKQAGVLQNLDDGGQGELVATLVALAAVLTGARPSNGSFKPGHGDIALAEKSLKLVETCLTMNSNSKPSRDWKELVKHLLGILDTDAEDDRGRESSLSSDTAESAAEKMVAEVRLSALRVLRLVATEHERVVDVGRCAGFQIIARLARCRSSALSCEATATIANLLSTLEADRARSAAMSDMFFRGRTGRWGKVGRFSNATRTTSDSRSRVSSECSGRGAEAEERGFEASPSSASSSSSLAGAANFVYSSFQALVGRENGRSPSPVNMSLPARGANSLGHPPTAVLRESLREEEARVAKLGIIGLPDLDGGSVPAVELTPKTEIGSSSQASPCAVDEFASKVVATEDVEMNESVPEMMLAQGVLPVLVEVIAASCDDAGASFLRGDGVAGDVEALPMGQTDSRENTGTQLDALEAAVSILEGRPHAQAEFDSLGGFHRLSRLIHSLAGNEADQLPQACDAGKSADHGRGQGGVFRARSPVKGADSSSGAQHALDATFDALFRLAINGRSVLPGARADGVQAVSALLMLVSRSPSVAVSLRAVRILQALLRVRALNAVVLETCGAAEILAGAAAQLAFQRPRKICASAERGITVSRGEMGDAREECLGRMAWSAKEKRELLSTMNEVVRMLAAVYSRQDAHALERYANIMLTASTARLGGNFQGRLGIECSSCGLTLSKDTGGTFQRCLMAGCGGIGGMCSMCDVESHMDPGKSGHIRVPVVARGCEEFSSSEGPSHSKPDPEWAVEAGKALLEAMVMMLDDREYFGLPPTASLTSKCENTTGADGGLKEQDAKPSTSVLTAMLFIAQDQLLVPWHTKTDADDGREIAGREQHPIPHAASTEIGGETASGSSSANQSLRGGSGVDWTEGWLLEVLGIVARFVVRGDNTMLGEFGSAGGWSVLAHLARLSRPPYRWHPSLHSSTSQILHDRTDVAEQTRRQTGDAVESDLDEGERLSEAWLGWVGARRLAVWILREALLTGAGQQGAHQKGAVALEQPARWLVWLVENLMDAKTPTGDGSTSQSVQDDVVMRHAILNEVRLAIGSFAPCEVVMQGCTRLLPLVALRADSMGAGDSDVKQARGRRATVSPNRHPEAQAGAANMKVVGRLAGDQLGVVRDALVSEGLMDALMAIVERDSSDDTSSSSGRARRSESSLALVCLAELAAGTEKAKAWLGSKLGYDIIATAAHGARVAIYAQHFSLWLEASVRRRGGGKALLHPPFSTLVTGHRHSVTFTTNEARESKSEGSDVMGDGATNDRESRRGRTDGRSGRRRSWRKRSPQSRSNPDVKDTSAWVPRTLPKLPLTMSKEDEPEVEQLAADGRTSDEKRREAEKKTANASLFDALWLPPGLLTLAQDVLVINRTRGTGGGPRGEERYFIAQARGASHDTTWDSGAALWRPAGAKFRGLDAAVFPFLLLPLIPAQHQPQAAGQLSRLLDADPANAAVLCHLRVPLALLKLACRLLDQSQVRNLYFRLAAQLMSHHMSPADAMELFHLASLQPSAWARLGRFRVTSLADLIPPGDFGRQRQTEVVSAKKDAEDKRLAALKNGNVDWALPPHSGELQMQLLYVIGTVVEAPAPAWFFHMNGGIGSGLVAGPLGRFPSPKVGYSLSMWLRPALISGRSGGETALFLLRGRTEDGAQRSFLRVVLRRCRHPGYHSAPSAAAGIGAREDDDQGEGSDDASAVIEISTSVETRQDEAIGIDGCSSLITGVVSDPEVRCGRWQYLVVALTKRPDPDSGAAGGLWPTGSMAVFVDGERRSVSKGGRVKNGDASVTEPQEPAYPVAGLGSISLSASVGFEEDSCRRESSIVLDQPAARFSGQMATVALVEGALTSDMAKANFLRGPGATPPGKRILFTAPGDLPPTPFLDPLGEDETRACGENTISTRLNDQLQCGRMIGAERSDMEIDGIAEDAQPVDRSGGSSKGTGKGEGISVVVDTCVQSEVPSSDALVLEPNDAAHKRPSSATVEGDPSAIAVGDTSLSCAERDSPPQSRKPHLISRRRTAIQPRLSILLAPHQRAIDSKYGLARDTSSGGARSSTIPGTLGHSHKDDMAATAPVPGGGDVSTTVASLAVAAGCGGGKDPGADGRVSFRLAGSGTWVYATTPLHAAVQAAGGFRLCLPFLRMDHARQVAALRVLAGLLEASAEGMDAFRVRDGFNVLYHALARGDAALHQLSSDSFDTLFDLMTSEALQEAVDVPAASISAVALSDAPASGGGADGGYRTGGVGGVKPVRSPEALRLVVDLLGHCERAPELQARVMETLVDALDSSSSGIQVWRRAFNESGAFAPLLYLLSPPTYASFEGEADHVADSVVGVSIRTSSIRRVPSFMSSSATGAGSMREEGTIGKWVSSGERPAVAAGSAAVTQTARMLQVLIAGSAGVAPVVRPQDPTAAIASSTSAGCTPEQLAILVGFALRCHLETEALGDMARREMLNTGQEDSLGSARERGSSASPGSALSLLALTRRVCGTVLDLLVQLCGGDGGAVVVGMMSTAFPAGGHFFVPLELMSSSHVETRVSAIKLLSLMLVRKGDDGRRSSTSTFFSSDESHGVGRPGADPQALRAFEKLGGFAAMCRQLELHTPCQAVCDALMGMIFGVWGSKHEPRPIREKDVLAIKGNKESWLRAWWRDYSSSPDEDTTNQPSAAAQGQQTEGSSLVNRLMGPSAAPTAAPTPYPTASPVCDVSTQGAVVSVTPSETAVLNEDGVDREQKCESQQKHSGPDKGIVEPPMADIDATVDQETQDVASATVECTSEEQHTENQTSANGVVKPGRFAALLKAVEAHNSVAPLRSEAAVHAAMMAQSHSGGADKLGEKEETGFLTGFFKRLSQDHAAGENTATRGAAPEIAAISASAKTSLPSASVPVDRGVANVSALASVKEKSAEEGLLEVRTEPSVDEDKSGSEGPREQKGYHALADTGSGEGDGGGSSGSEALNIVLPEAVEVLMRVLQRAPHPAVLARPLLQLESAVAWLPSAAGGGNEGHDPIRGGSSRRDFGSTRSVGREGNSETGLKFGTGKGSAGTGGSAGISGASGVGVGRTKGQDGSGRERNADSFMSRQGWLAWCFRLVDALGSRNDRGDLVPGRMSVGYGGGDGDIGGSDRWGIGGSEASEAGGYLDDSHSETTDPGSAFSYYESSSVGRSLAQDGGLAALEAFTGPVYGLVAALLEQDMARAPRDKRGHRFLELFSLSAANAFQAAVLEDALDGIQDSPMLSSDEGNKAQQLSPIRSGAAGGGPSGDGGNDGNVRRLESLRELLSAALDRRPDLPLGLCVKSVHTINLLGYHNSHEARNRMKAVGLLGVRDDLIRRCLFHPTAAASEQVAALSQVEDALETLVSQPGKTGGETESSVAGEVAVQLLHLFVQLTANAANPPALSAPLAATTAGPPSPVMRNNTAISSARTAQVAAARALGRVVVASASCRSTVIRTVRDPQLLARLLPALRCPLTAEEMEAIELGNIPDSLPTITTSSRWSLGSLSLLPNSTGPTSSCISDDAEDDPEKTTAATATLQQPSPQPNTVNTVTKKAFFPPTPSPSASGLVGSWAPAVPNGGIAHTDSGEIVTVNNSGLIAATAAGGSSTQFRLDEVLEEDEQYDESTDGIAYDHQLEADETAVVGTSSGALEGDTSVGNGSKSPPRRRGRRRSSSDLSAGSLGSFSGAFAGGGGATGAVPKARAAGVSVGGSSWHGSNTGGGRSLGAAGGWGILEHDLQTFVRWWNGEEIQEMREQLCRRVSKALAPLAKARSKTAAKQAAKREKAVRQAQKREAESSAAKEKAASDAIERCRAHAERAADRTSATVDNWLAERRRRWEAGRTRCEELAPPAGGSWGVVGGGSTGTVPVSENAADDSSVVMEKDGVGGQGMAGLGMGGGRRVERKANGKCLGWNWRERAEAGLSFEDFFETFASGDGDGLDKILTEEGMAGASGGTSRGTEDRCQNDVNCRVPLER